MFIIDALLWFAQFGLLLFAVDVLWRVGWSTGNIV